MIDAIKYADRFISSYHEMEKKTYNFSFGIIKYAVKNVTEAAYLCDSWKNRKRDFGVFFLNLSHSKQYCFLKFWGLNDPEADEYFEFVNKDARAMLFIDPPGSILWGHELLKFFNNHGINEECALDVRLSELPNKGECYGNSNNWANYIIGLPAAIKESVIAQILAHCINSKPTIFSPFGE